MRRRKLKRRGFADRGGARLLLLVRRPIKRLINRQHGDLFGCQLLHQLGVLGWPDETDQGAAFAHQGEGWFGPIASPYGQHLISITSVEQGRPVGMVSVRDAMGPELESFVYEMLRQEQVSQVLA